MKEGDFVSVRLNRSRTVEGKQSFLGTVLSVWQPGLA